MGIYLPKFSFENHLHTISNNSRRVLFISTSFKLNLHSCTTNPIHVTITIIWSDKICTKELGFTLVLFNVQPYDYEQQLESIIYKWRCINFKSHWVSAICNIKRYLVDIWPSNIWNRTQGLAITTKTINVFRSLMNNMNEKYKMSVNPSS